MRSSALKGFTALFTMTLVVFKQVSREGLGYIVTNIDFGACIDESAALLSTKTMADLYNKTSRPLQAFINKSLLMPPLVNFREKFRISLKYNLATCMIEKIMSTFRAAMFCYLNRRSKFVEEGRSISTESWISLSKNPSKCFNCSKVIECFLIKIHENLLAYYTKSRALTESEYFYIQHFAPINWYCNLKKSYDKMVFMRYNRYNRNALANGFVAVLSQAFVPHSQTNYIGKEVLRQLPKHATLNREVRKKVEKKLWTSPHLLCFLMHIYYYDFIIFDYSFPKEIGFCDEMTPLKQTK